MISTLEDASRPPVWPRLRPYVYITPAAFILTAFLFVPLIAVVILSAYDWNLISDNPQFVGIQNYRQLLTSAEFAQTLLQTLKYLVLGLLGNFVFPVALAVLTVNVSPRASAIYRSLLFLPSIIATSVGAVVWQFLFLPAGGPINESLGYIGIQGPNWLTDSFWALPSIAFTSSWNTFGFNYVIALGGLAAIPRDVVEAARLDGAERLSMLFRITVPLASPTLVFLSLISLLQALPHAFVAIQIMTGGGPGNFSNNLFYNVYRTGFTFFQVGESAAGAVFLVALLSIFAIAQFKITVRRATFDAHN